MTEIDIAGAEFGCHKSPELARTLKDVGINEWQCEQEASEDPEHKTHSEAILVCPGRNPDGSCGLKKVLASVISLEGPQDPPIR